MRIKKQYLNSLIEYPIEFYVPDNNTKEKWEYETCSKCVFWNGGKNKDHVHIGCKK